jgi:hypothetical protein
MRAVEYGFFYSVPRIEGEDLDLTATLELVPGKTKDFETCALEVADRYEMMHGRKDERPTERPESIG